MISFIKSNVSLWKKSKLLNPILMSLVILLLSIQFAAQASPTSEHPEKPFLSTIPILFLSPSQNYVTKESSLTLHPERGAFAASIFRQNKFNYNFKIQPDPQAPAIIIIPGMGGVSDEKSTLYLSELAYKNGYTIITITSTTHWSFALAASSSGRVGHLPDDSKDLYEVIKLIKSKLEKSYQISPSAWSLMGASYGALDSSFLFAQDLEDKVFQFQSVILINPPLNRTMAVMKVDQFYNQGKQWPSQKKKDLEFDFLGRLVLVNLKMIPINTYTDLRSYFPMAEEELAWLLGSTFRKVVLNSAFISNRLENIETSLNEDAFQGDIVSYIRESLYKKHYGAQTPEDYLKLEQESDFMTALSKNNSEILNNKKVVLFHATNDFLSFPESDDLLNELNMEKHIYPFGGHVGMISDAAVIKDLESTLIRLKN